MSLIFFHITYLIEYLNCLLIDVDVICYNAYDVKCPKRNLIFSL